jgi:hypothetical protein
MVGEAINRLIKHHHKSLKERVRGSFALFLTSGIFLDFFSMYCIQDCLVCRPLDSAVSEAAWIKPRTVATSALAVRRSNHWARSHPYSARSHPLFFILTRDGKEDKEQKSQCWHFFLENVFF